MLVNANTDLSQPSERAVLTILDLNSEFAKLRMLRDPRRRKPTAGRLSLG